MKIYFNFPPNDSRRFYLISRELKSASKVGIFFRSPCDKVEAGDVGEDKEAQSESVEKANYEWSVVRWRS